MGTAAPARQGRAGGLPPTALVGIGVIAVLVIAITFVLVTEDDSGSSDGELSEEEREAVNLSSALLTNADMEEGVSGTPPGSDDTSFDYQGGPQCADLIQILSRGRAEGQESEPDAVVAFESDDGSLHVRHSLSWTDEEWPTLDEYREATVSCPEITFVGIEADGSDSAVTMEPVELEPLGDAHLGIAAEHQISAGSNAHQILIRWDRNGLRSTVSIASTDPDQAGPDDIREEARRLSEITDPRIVAALGEE